MITVDITGIENSIGTLRLMGNALGDLKPFLQEAGEYMVESIRENFNAGGRPDIWQIITGAGRPSHLSYTGGLKNSISILEMGTDSVTIGSGDANLLKVGGLQWGATSLNSKARMGAIITMLKKRGDFNPDYNAPVKGSVTLKPRQFIMFQMQQGGDVDHILDLLNKHILTKG